MARMPGFCPVASGDGVMFSENAPAINSNACADYSDKAHDAVFMF